MTVNKKKIIGGLFWTFSERMAAQIVSVIVGIILARLLSPSEYGTVALLTVFIVIANVFVLNGFGSSLIQKKDADNLDFSTVFFFGIFFSCILYGIIFLLAPVIAGFYGIPLIVPLLRVLAIKIPISAINSVQQAYVSRKMIFKKFFFATIVGTIISAFVGIWMAYNGFGAWALVGQDLTNTLIDTVVLWITVKWRPQMGFSFIRLKQLFAYGWKIMIQGLLTSIYANIRSLLLGKFYSTQDLAYYNKGSNYPNLIVTNVDSAMGQTLFPAMSKEQSNFETIKMMISKSTRVSSYIMSPLLIGFIVCARPFTILLLTEKWLPMVPYLRIICIVLLIRPAQSAIVQAIKATGRSDIALKMDIPAKVFSLLVLFLSIRFGVIYVAISEIVGEYTCLLIYLYASKKLVGYSIKNVIEDMCSNVLSALAMGAIVVGICRWMHCGNLLLLILQVVIGIISYAGLSVVTKNDSFVYIKNTIMDWRKGASK